MPTSRYALTRLSSAAAFVFATLCAAAPAHADWAAPQAPAIPAADGAVLIPGVAVPPVATRTYRAVVEATQAADKPDALIVLMAYENDGYALLKF